VIPTYFREMAAARPEVLLALTLSSPPSRTVADGKVTLERSADEVLVRFPRESRRSGPRIITTKQTIGIGILLQYLIEKRGEAFQSELERVLDDAARGEARDVVAREGVFRRGEGLHEEIFGFDRHSAMSKRIYERLGITTEDLEEAAQRTRAAFIFLEDRRLAVDPFYTPELMVLLGFVPVHFSVRTERGERVYRELKINAPYLTARASWEKGQSGKQAFKFEYSIRLVQIVRAALNGLGVTCAEQELVEREAHGRPIVPLEEFPSLDGEESV
jgi:DNA-binding transcriptional LysR family regulator